MPHSVLSSFEGLSVLAPRTHGALSVHPLVADHPSGKTFRTLTEALATGAFRVEECARESVPQLLVVNDLDEPVLIIDGEILVGGKQDRTVNTTILVPARSRLEVPVSCVEAGRWGGGRGFRRSGGVMFSQGRASRARSVSESLRRGRGYSSDQQRVWNEVRACLRDVGADAPTQSVMRASERRASDVSGYVAALAPVEGQVGSVFTLAGRVVGVEVLPTPQLYARTHEQLVRSVALDAVACEARGERADDREPESVEAFLEEVAAARREEHPAVGMGSAVRLEGERLTGSRLDHDGALVHCVAFRVDGGPGPDGDRAFVDDFRLTSRDEARLRHERRVRRALGDVDPQARSEWTETGCCRPFSPPPSLTAGRRWLLESQERLEWYAMQACRAAGLSHRDATDVADEAFERLWRELQHEDAEAVSPRRRLAETCREVARERALARYGRLPVAGRPEPLPLPAPETDLDQGRAAFVHVVTIEALAAALDALRSGRPVALASRGDAAGWHCVLPTDVVLLACATPDGLVAHVAANVAGYEGGDPVVTAGNVHRSSVVERAREVRIPLHAEYAPGALHRVTREDLRFLRVALA